MLVETAFHASVEPESWHSGGQGERMNAPAAVGISGCGRWLYGSNRGHDSLACFEVVTDGAGPVSVAALACLPIVAATVVGGGQVSLIPKGNVASGGSLPWSFASPGSAAPCVLDGGLVLVQNQVIPTPLHVLCRISPIFPPFFSPFFARFHRLDEAVPTSPKPDSRATK